MIANPNSNLPKRLQWYIVLAALTCVSASPSTVEPKTIFAGSASLKQQLGVVGQSDARVKRYLRRNSDATESMDDENEDRGGNLGPAIDQGLAGAIDSVEGGVTSGVIAAIDQGLAAKVGEAGKSDVIPGNSGKNVHLVAKDGELVKETVGSSIQDDINQKFKSVMGDKLELYEKEVKKEENVERKNMFKSEEFTEWNNYVDARFPKEPAAAAQAKAESLLTICESNDLIKMLATGRTDKNTRAIASNLEMGLLRKWALAGGNEDNIMELLTFGKSKKEVWASDTMRVWFDFMIHQKRNPYELFVTHFTERSRNKELVELIDATEDDTWARTVAPIFAEHLLQTWEDSDISVVRSYELLGLNKENPDKLLKSPMLSWWVNYVELLGSDPYQVLLLTMRKHMSDKNINSILAAAKADGTNESIWRILLHLQEKRQRLKREHPQAERWQMDGKWVVDVFNDLKLQDKGQEMLGTKKWNAWVSYVTFLEEQKQVKDQRETAMVIYSVLKSKLSSQDLTKLVATAKTVEETQEIAKKWEWRIAQRTSDDVFDLLKLKEKGDAVFETPEFKSWMFYVKELNSAKKHKDDVELAYRLYGHYGPDVERMLKKSEKTASAKNDEDTKSIVRMLLKVFEKKKSLEKTSPVEMELEKTSPVEMDIEKTSPAEMELEETSHEKKRLGKRPRTSSLAVATESLKRMKLLDESEPPMGI
ncbi:unnamed protein product [Peronospora farinosa]|uniref:RxLR effector protein n=1 Tax=Peronospora farinosa TaxID=134698 RepID=A0ABN8CEZ3_9STRA|nr:unnamed protein product [Peronospora farinosa]